MNRFGVVVVGLVLCMAMIAGCNAMQKDAKPAKAAKPKTISLFNGKDLDNWTFYSKDPNARKEDVFTVKDRVIHCVGKPVGYIRTNDDYTSYVLRLQWRFSNPGNSGVLLRMQEPDKIWPKSVEAQLHHQNAGDIWVIDNYP